MWKLFSQRNGLYYFGHFRALVARFSLPIPEFRQKRFWMSPVVKMSSKADPRENSEESAQTKL